MSEEHDRSNTAARETEGGIDRMADKELTLDDMKIVAGGAEGGYSGSSSGSFNA